MFWAVRGGLLCTVLLALLATDFLGLVAGGSPGQEEREGEVLIPIPPGFRSMPLEQLRPSTRSDPSRQPLLPGFLLSLLLPLAPSSLGK